MLSYQHAYHAGSRADIHKHDILCRVLESLRVKDAPMVYVETHAGRGVYDLTGTEAKKTGEAAEGWLKIESDMREILKLSPLYIAAIRAVNKGALSPFYPGSPMVAAHMLREKDSMRLFELHPAEYAALKNNLGQDKRAQIIKQDGLEGVLELKTPPSLILIDPSYEIKSEYETMPGFLAKLHQKFPKAMVLLWSPMLAAKRHEPMIKTIREKFPQSAFSELTWSRPQDGRGMYGSIIVGINAGGVF